MNPVIQAQPHDFLTNRLQSHGHYTAMRFNDDHHQNLHVGDMVELHGHSDIMDRQKYKVISKLDHPNLHQAVQSIEHSDMDLRDKLVLEHSFKDSYKTYKSGSFSGPEAHPVTTIQLEPHGIAGGGYVHPPTVL